MVAGGDGGVGVGGLHGAAQMASARGRCVLNAHVQADHSQRGELAGEGGRQGLGPAFADQGDFADAVAVEAAPPARCQSSAISAVLDRTSASYAGRST